MSMPPPWLKCGIRNRTFDVFQTIDQVRRQSRQKHLADGPARHRPGGGQ